MDVGLATFEVVVQVVPEQVDQVDGVVPGVLPGVPGEQDKGDVTHALTRPRIRVLQTHRRLSVTRALSVSMVFNNSFIETYLLLNKTVGAVALAFLPSLNSRMKTSLRMMSLASLKIVEKMTVTRSDLACTYIVSSSL